MKALALQASVISSGTASKVLTKPYHLKPELVQQPALLCLWVTPAQTPLSLPGDVSGSLLGSIGGLRRQAAAGTHPDHPIGAVAPTDAVQGLHEADEAVQQLPLLLLGAGPVSVHIAVSLPLHDALGGADAGRQQQEPSPPELERLDEAAGTGETGQGSAQLPAKGLAAATSIHLRHVAGSAGTIS